MADYYPLLAKAVAGLPDSTPETRHSVYERARRALYGQLRNLDPPVPEEAIEREAQALERAVAQIETELTSRSGPERGAPPSGTEFIGSGSLADRLPAREPGAAPPASDSPEPGFVPSARQTVQAARTPRAPPPLKVRRDVAGMNPATNLAGPTPVSAQGDRPAGPSGLKPPSTRDDSQVAAAGIEPIAPDASGPEALLLNAPSLEQLAPDAADSSPEGFEPASRIRLEAQRPFAPRPDGDRGAVKRVGIVAGIVGLVVVLVATAAYKLRDRPEDLVRLQPSPSTIQGDAGAGGKIIDRIDTGTATPGTPAASAGVPSSTAERNDAGKNNSGLGNPPVPVARRAALLMESPDGQAKVKTILGTVVWRVDNVSNGPDEPLSMAVRAEIDIAEEGLQAVMTIQKNFDSTLPASHTMKLSFSVPPDSPLANIQQVSVLLRREDTPMGDALKGITVPVTANSFLIGLSHGDAEASNLDLLRTREWFDIPMVLANGHIAKLTFEKGPSGRSAIDDAMASWQAR
jgi:hypothetical protein